MHLKTMSVVITGLLIALPALGAPNSKPVVATDVQCSGCVNQRDVASNAVGAEQIQPGAVGISEIAPDSVGETHLTATLLKRIEALEAVPRTVQVLANGESIGALIQISEVNAGHGYLVLSPKKYFFYVQASEQESETTAVGRLWRPVIYYSGPNCSGEPYLPGDSYGAATFDGYSWTLQTFVGAILNQGLVVEESNDAGWMRRLYLLRGVTGNEGHPNFQSAWYEGACGNVPFLASIDYYLRLLPNDPAITGVPDVPFLGPITLQ